MILNVKSRAIDNVKTTWIIWFYLFSLFFFGNIAQGILYADIFLIAFTVILATANLNIYNRQLFLLLAIVAYALFSGLLSLLNETNQAFFVLVFFMRLTAFAIMFVMGFIFRNEVLVAVSRILPVIVLMVVVYSLYNMLTDYREHYSYVTILSTWSPAASGFALGATGLFCVLTAEQLEATKVKYYRWLGYFLVGLSLLTFINSALASLLPALVFLFAVRAYNADKFLKSHFIFYFCSLFFALPVILSWGKEFFWRASWLAVNLEYRLAKVSAIFNGMCTDFYCLMVGNGIGAHSFWNGNTYGQTAILAFDQLHGRILIEWGILGSVLWVTFLISLVVRKRGRINYKVMIFIVFGVLFGIGSEFIFEAYSGQLFGLFLGSLYSLSLRPHMKGIGCEKFHS